MLCRSRRKVRRISFPSCCPPSAPVHAGHDVRPHPRAGGSRAGPAPYIFPERAVVRAGTEVSVPEQGGVTRRVGVLYAVRFAASRRKPRSAARNARSGGEGRRFACSFDPAGLFAAPSWGCCARTGPACQSHEPQGHLFARLVRTSRRLAWLIRVKWRIGGSIMHPIDRTTRINHDPGRRGAARRHPGPTVSANITSAPPRSRYKTTRISFEGQSTPN